MDVIDIPGLGPHLRFRCHEGRRHLIKIKTMTAYGETGDGGDDSYIIASGRQYVLLEPLDNVLSAIQQHQAEIHGY